MRLLAGLIGLAVFVLSVAGLLTGTHISMSFVLMGVFKMLLVVSFGVILGTIFCWGNPRVIPMDWRIQLPVVPPIRHTPPRVRQPNLRITR